MTNSWMNEDGEPIMDGAAWRFEQQLDAEAAEERAWMAWNEDSMGDYPEECPDCGSDECEGDCAEDEDDFVMEDQWLDGSYEE